MCPPCLRPRGARWSSTSPQRIRRGNFEDGPQCLAASTLALARPRARLSRVEATTEPGPRATAAGVGARACSAPRSPRTYAGAIALTAVLLAGIVLLPRLVALHEASIVGREAPDFSLDLIANGATLGGDGSAVTMSHLRGRAVLLDFWATWCAPCRVEAPIVDQIARRWRDRGVVVVGVDTDAPDQGDPRQFALAEGLSYPIVHDTKGEASRLYPKGESRLFSRSRKHLCAVAVNSLAALTPSSEPAHMPCRELARERAAGQRASKE